MSNYTPITDFSVKDSLTSGDPQKIILGADVDAELTAIQTAIATKADFVVTDPNADRILFWDDSAGSIAYLAPSSNLTITGTTIDLSSSITISGALSAATLTLSGALTYGGVTLTAAVTGTGKMVLDTAPTISGTLTAGTFSGSGASLTSLNGTNISSGTVADARLSANVALLNVANTWTAAGTHTFSAANNAARIAVGNTNASIALISFSTNSTLRGYVGADGGGGQITGGAAGDMDFIAQSGNLLFSGNGGTTAHLKLSSSGTITTPNAAADEVGYKGMPVFTDPPSNQFTLSQSPGAFYNLSANATIPANGSVAFPVGTVITCHNNTGGTITIAITTDTLIQAITASTGTRTLASHAIVTLVKVASTTWYIIGAGVT